MAVPRLLVASTSARRPYDSRRRRAAAARGRDEPSAEVRLVQRALRAVARHDGRASMRDYVPTDVRMGEPGRARRSDVVFLEQQVLGLPVYGARRSVIFASRRTYVTGARVAIGIPARLTPAVTAQDAAVKAVRTVTGRTRIGVASTLAVGSGPDRTSAITLEGLASPVMAHLAVFGAGRTRLAWVAQVALPDGDGFEVVLDAVTQKVLRQRPTINHAVACLDIAPAAGGPGAGTGPLEVRFDAAWTDPARRRFDYVGSSSELALPARNPEGDFCTAAPPGDFPQTVLNAVSLANTGLTMLEPFGARVQGRVALTLLNALKADIDDVAGARPDLTRPVLKFARLKPTGRHAASDPGVLLHELGHLMLCAGVGGDRVAAPFEFTGESAQVSEGLADFVGLTLWNGIRRERMPAPPDVTTFGAWVFGSQGRDYTPFLGPGADIPTFPGTGPVHQRGMVLCTALLRARDAIAQATRPDEADAVMWSTLFASLTRMPHQDDSPRFCCVSFALRLVVPLAHRARLVAALSASRIPDVCPHLSRI